MPTQASQDDASSRPPDCASEARRPRQREGLRTRVVDGEVVILDRQHEQIHQLNATAAFIWARCDGTQTEAELGRALAQAFEVDPGRTEADVATTLRQLEALGLLEASTPPR